jgi:predicted acetyltransferase
MREIWRFLFGIDWVDEILAWYLPVDHPLLHMVARLDRLDLGVETGLWIRLVDVGAALSARSYATEDALVLELADEFLPANAGRWRIAGGAAEPTDDEPDLALDVQELASLYLGSFGASELVRAGLVRELREGAASRADALFATPRKPWTPEIF